MPLSVEPTPGLAPLMTDPETHVDVTDRQGRQLGVVTVAGVVEVDIGDVIGISGPVDSRQFGAWTVAATQSGAWTVDVGSLPDVTGDVSIDGPVAVTQSGPWTVGLQEPVEVAGGVALMVDDIPVSQAAPMPIDGDVGILGPVSVSQSGGWTVGITGPVEVPMDRLPPSLTAAGNLKVAIMEGGGAGGGVSDVSDRAERLLGEVTGTVDVGNWPTVQPVSLASVPTHPVTQSGEWVVGFDSTPDVSVLNWPNPLQVAGTFWPATQPVSGTFWQSTQPVSLVSVPTHAVTQSGAWNVGVASALPAGTNNIGDVDVLSLPAISGTVALDAPTLAALETIQVGNLATKQLVYVTPGTPGSVTAAAGQAVTVTLPAVPAKYHDITMVQIVKYNTAAVTGDATPIVVTTTNLSGLAWTFPKAGAIGTVVEQRLEPAAPVRSAAVNTATTIVCPATTSVIWRVNILYALGD